MKHPPALTPLYGLTTGTDNTVHGFTRETLLVTRGMGVGPLKPQSLFSVARAPQVFFT